MPLPIPGRAVEALRRSTAFLTSTHRNRAGTGSAIVLPNDTLITNAHVVVGSALEAESWEGKTAAAAVLQMDRSRDLALLRAPGLNAPPASLADSDSVRPGTPVIAVGNPIGFKGAVSTGTVHTLGPLAIRGADRMLYHRWIHADIHLAPGNSGGPLADWEGRVIGVNTMVVYGGLALAVPSRSMQAFLMRNKRRRLGVTLRAVPLSPPSIGLLILEITPDGIAASASLLPGDILVAANGKSFAYIDDLETLLAVSAEPLLTLEFRRGGVSKGRRVTVPWASEPVTTAA